MTDKDKAERIVILLKTMNELQGEVEKLFREIGIRGCNAGIFSHHYQVMDDGARKLAKLLNIEPRIIPMIDYKNQYALCDIEDDLAVMAVEEKK